MLNLKEPSALSGRNLCRGGAQFKLNFFKYSLNFFKYSVLCRELWKTSQKKISLAHCVLMSRINVYFFVCFGFVGLGGGGICDFFLFLLGFFLLLPYTPLPHNEVAGS